MRSDTPAPLEPEITPGLIAWLEYTFPALPAKPGMTMEDIFYNGGQQSVMEHLRSKMDLQDLERRELSGHAATI